jgi:hypothetical protein
MGLPPVTSVVFLIAGSHIGKTWVSWRHVRNASATQCERYVQSTARLAIHLQFDNSANAFGIKNIAFEDRYKNRSLQSDGLLAVGS